MPIIALAPIFNNMFSTTSSHPPAPRGDDRRVLPDLRQHLRGLTQIDPVHDELMRSYAASEWTILRKVRVPARCRSSSPASSSPSSLVRHRRRRRRVLRRAPERAGQPHHLGRRGHRLRAGVGLRGRRLPARPGLLSSPRRARAPRHAVAGRAGRPSLTIHTTRPKGRTHMRGTDSDRAMRGRGSGPGARRRRLRQRQRQRLGHDRRRPRPPRRRRRRRRRRAPRRPITTGDLKPVKLQLQWFTQAQFAGYFAARGAGLLQGRGPRRRRSSRAASTSCPQTVLAQGNADFAIAWVPKALQSREQGADITDIGQIFQRSGTLQVSLQGQEHHRPGRPQGQEGRQLGLRQRVRAVRRA